MTLLLRITNTYRFAGGLANAFVSRWTSSFLVLLFVASLIPSGNAQDKKRGDSADQGAGATALGESRRKQVIEEVIVKAQKREQFLQDVPISMSVITDQFIAEQGITSVQEALLYAPNVKFAETNLFSSPNCRGFTTDSRNIAFEPPCGIAVDGVSYTNPSYFSAALFDMQRVEVMRGPQGTTFGKNTTAGVVHLLTQDPTNEFTGHASTQMGELDRRRYEAAVGGPLIPGIVNFRIAGLKDDREGYMKNTTAAIADAAVERAGGWDREGFRVKLSFPDILGSELQLTYERADFSTDGNTAEIFDVDSTSAAFFREWDPNADFIKGNNINSMEGPSGATRKSKRMQVDWGIDVFEWRFDAVAAKVLLDSDVFSDVDVTPAPTGSIGRSDENPATTLEFRVLSPDLPGFYGLEELFGWNLGRSEVLAGVFYQKRKIDDSRALLELNDSPVLALAVADGTDLPPSLAALLATEGPGVTERFLMLFNQDADTVAAFTQLQWYFTDRWMLQLGMRYSEETKKGRWDASLSDPSPVLTATLAEDFTAEESVSEYQFQPKLTLSFNPTDNISLFAHWTRGFKSGGFNAFVFKDPEDDEMESSDEARLPLTFDPEIATEWGLDAKMTLFDGTMSLNISLYQLDLEDFQVLTEEREKESITGQALLPAVSIGVVNAAKARAQGIEIDLTYLPTNWLTLIATVGMNDTTFLDFPINECATDRTNTDGDDDPRCDASGRPFPRTPKWNNTLTTNTHFPLSFIGLEDLDVLAGVTVEYFSSQFLDTDLDPRRKQSSFSRLKAYVGLANPEQGWSFRVVGENLTDERTSVRQDDNIAGGTLNFPESPRLIYGQFRLEF